MTSPCCSLRGYSQQSTVSVASEGKTLVNNNAYPFLGAPRVIIEQEQAMHKAKFEFDSILTLLKDAASQGFQLREVESILR